MRRAKTQTLGEVIQAYLKSLKIDKKLMEVQLVKSWEEVVGKTIANSTKSIYIKDRKLYVHFYSSVIRKELSMIKAGLISRLNENFSEPVIDDIILK